MSSPNINHTVFTRLGDCTNKMCGSVGNESHGEGPDALVYCGTAMLAKGGFHDGILSDEST